MISKEDTYILLSDIEESGIDVTLPIKLLSTSATIPLSVLKFINNSRPLELSMFYENLRKNYNNKHSKLYGNIVKEVDNPTTVITTLSCLLTQVVLFADKSENREMFLKHARANEITKALSIYFSTYDLTLCIQLLKYVKADIKCLESIKN